MYILTKYKLLFLSHWINLRVKSDWYLQIFIDNYRKISTTIDKKNFHFSPFTLVYSLNLVPFDFYLY